MTRSSWLAFVGMVVFTMGTSIVTPLFPLYKQEFGLSNGTITLLFATYTAMVVPTMLVAGNLSGFDRFDAEPEPERPAVRVVSSG